MRTIRIKLYKFNELTEAAQQKAIEKLYDINVDSDWYEFTYEDAESIGLKLKYFDLERRTISGSFITSAGEVVEDILANHGEKCGTYKTALKYKNCFQSTSDEIDEDILDNMEDEFLSELLQDYISLLREEFDFLTSEKAIIDTIEANEYEFTKDGKLA